MMAEVNKGSRGEAEEDQQLTVETYSHAIHSANTTFDMSLLRRKLLRDSLKASHA